MVRRLAMLVALRHRGASAPVPNRGRLVRDDRSGHCSRLEICSALQQRLDCFDQQVSRSFIKITGEARGAESIRHLGVAGIERKEQQRHIGHHAADHARRSNAGHLWHAEVEDDDVRLQRRSLLDGFHAIYRFAANFPSLVCFEQFARTTARFWVIVRNQNTSHSL